MKIMKVIDLLTSVLEMTPGDSLLYFTGAFAFHKSIHEDTQFGYKICGLSNLALRLEEMDQILLVSHRIEDFHYNYYIIRKKNAPEISEDFIEQVKRAQTAFDSCDGLQGLGEIDYRGIPERERLHEGRFR